MDVVTGIVAPLLGGLLLIGLIIAANGYFVAQEFAYMTVDRSRVEARAEQGDKVAQRIRRITGRTSFLLSGAQLGITVTGLMVGYVAQPLVGTAVGELLGGAGVPTGVGVVIGTVGVLVVATFVQMLFGELFPKNLALANPYPVAQGLSATTLLYMRVMGWAIRFFDSSANALLRLVRVEPVEDVAHSANLHDLQRIVDASREAGRLPADLSLVLDRMIDFPQRHVSHALVPRSRVDVVPTEASLADLLETMHGGHSRYPVLDEEGEVVGVVHVADVLAAHRRGDQGRTAADLGRPPTVVPTLMPLTSALATLERSGDQMCCVVDEWGGFVGIVTAEDLVEEVVGEITDEHDQPGDPHLRPDADAGETVWTVRGDAPLDEVAREIGLRLPDGEAQSVAGMTIEALGALPEVGTRVDVRLPVDPLELAYDDHPPVRLLHVTVLEVARHVPTLLRLEAEAMPPEELDEPARAEEVDA